MAIDLHSLLAPYALEALDPNERGDFETHLNRCESCRRELVGFAATVCRLGEAEAAAPPVSLRERVVSEIRDTAQERPRFTLLNERRSIRRLLPRLAVAAIFVVGTGAFISEREEAGDFRFANESVTSVLAAEDASTRSSAFKGGGNVRMIASSAKDTAVVVADNLPVLSDGRVYQVWMINQGVSDSKGTFRTRSLMILAGLKDVDRVAVTIEPRGGSARPTTPPIITLAM